MDEFTSRKIAKDMDFVKKTLARMDTTLALQHQSLEIHIKRTELLEKKLEPVERHVEQVVGVGKFILFVSLIATIIAGAYAVIH